MWKTKPVWQDSESQIIALAISVYNAEKLRFQQRNPARAVDCSDEEKIAGGLGGVRLTEVRQRRIPLHQALPAAREPVERAGGLLDCWRRAK